MKKLALLLVMLAAHISKAQLITTIAGTGVGGYGGDGGPATAAMTNAPHSVCVDEMGNVYFTNLTGGTVIRKINTAGVITTFAGVSGIGGFSGDGGPATAAHFAGAKGVCVDGMGNIYVADETNARVRKINTAGVITTIAGTGLFGYTGDGGPATAAKLTSPWSLCCDASGNVYVGDVGTRTVRKISTTGIITTVAGTGLSGFSGDGGQATAAKLWQPKGLCLDTLGNLYIGDDLNMRIRKVTPAGIITTIAGNGTTGFSGDGGTATAAQLSHSEGLACDNAGNIYIADAWNGRIRMINASGIITTCAGIGTAAFSGDGGPATAAELNYPPGVAVDGNGYLYIADRLNHRVRKVCFAPAPVTVSGSHIVCDSATISLGASMPGGTWASTNGGTTVSSGGIVTGMLPGVDTIVYTYSNGCGIVSVSHAVTVNPLPYAGSISGADTVCIGSAITLTTSAPGGSWSSGNISVASISSAGYVSGVAAGATTITYTVYNSCDTAHAYAAVYVAACPGTGLNPVASPARALVVAPNPSTGTFNISLARGSNEEARVTITNIMGETIVSFTLPDGVTREIKVDAPPGIYTITATTGKEKITTRIKI